MSVQVAAMSELTRLPASVLIHIISLLENESVKALRLTCKGLSGFANRVLFRSISLYDTHGNYQLLESILIQPHLREEVFKLNLHTVDEDYDTDEEEEVDPPQGWQEILEQMSDLPNLQSVSLRFDKKCASDSSGNGYVYIFAPQTETYRATVLRWLFAGLTDLPRPIRELAIQNHQNVTPISRNVSNWMDEVFQTLEVLRLNVVHEGDFAAPENDIEKADVHEFFRRALPTYWLKPSMSSLRKLSLYSSLPWGFYPKVNMEGVHFPNLESLTLGNFSFADDKQLDWILEHSSTLKELYMDRCFIVFYVQIQDDEDIIERTPLMGSDMAHNPEDSDKLIYLYPCRWHDYFTSFQNGLPNLSCFGFGASPLWEQNKMPFENEWNLADELTEERYCPFLGEFVWYPFHLSSTAKWPDCDQQDLDALKALHQAIGQGTNMG